MILKSEDGEAVQRPTSFLGVLVLVLWEGTGVVVASGGGIVGNLGLVFHYPTGAKPGCGNVGIARGGRDFQGAVERGGKPGLLFHAFHGPGISTALFCVRACGRP